MKENYTDITVLLDRSGSMCSVRDDTIGGFNTFIEEQKKEEGYATFTLVQFDHEYEPNFSAINIKEVQLLNKKTYMPRGATALLDALGRTIVETGQRLNDMKEEDRPENVIFVIQTDGQENASVEYNWEKISEMIKHQKDKYNWEFIFLGAGEDVIKQAGKIGIGFGSSLNYTNNSAGNDAMFKSLSKGMSAYRSGTSAKDFFDNEDREAQTQAKGE